jgi:hypothetical protein
MRIFRIAWLPLLALPLLWLAPLLSDPGAFLYAPDSLYSDIAISHWPNALLIHRTILETGEVPLWNPTILGGAPFAADPLSGLYYPPLWLAAAFPNPLTFNILFLLHLMWAGMGAYALARGEGLPASTALLAGMVFGGLPKFIAHVAAGHPTLVFAAAWTPWLMLAARAVVRRGSYRYAVVAGLMAGTVFLADPRWAPLAFLAAGAYALTISTTVTWRRRIQLGAVAAAIALGIGAGLAVPLMEFTAQSTRSTLAPADMMRYSLPVSNLSGLILAGFGGEAEWVVYAGASVLLLAVFGFVLRFSVAPGDSPAARTSDPPHPPVSGKARVGGTGWFWAVLFVASVILALGENLPVYPILARVIPGLGLLRVPARWMFLGGLSLAMLAATGLGLILQCRSDPGKNGWTRRTGFVVAAVGGALAVGAAAMRLPAPLQIDGAVWFASGAALFAVSIPQVRPGWIVAAFLCILGVDLALANTRMIAPRPMERILEIGRTAAEYVAGEEGSAFRVYSPSYSIPQETAAQNRLRLLYGVDPLMLRSTVDVVSRASGIAMDAYAVVLPRFVTGDPAVDNRDAVPDARLLGLLNVKFVVSVFPMAGTGLRLVEDKDGAYIYANPLALPRAWLAENLSAWDTPLDGREVRIESESPNRLRIRAEGPGVLVVSEAMYPGWSAVVDGQPSEIGTAGGWWRAVSLGSGMHDVVLNFSPLTLWIGLAVAGLTLAAALGILRWAK